MKQPHEYFVKPANLSYAETARKLLELHILHLHLFGDMSNFLIKIPKKGSFAIPKSQNR